MASSRSFDRLRPVALSTFIEKRKKKKKEKLPALVPYFSIPIYQRYDECTCVGSSRAEVDKENKYQQLGNVEKWSRAWYAEPPGTTRVPDQREDKKKKNLSSRSSSILRSITIFLYFSIPLFLFLSLSFFIVIPSRSTSELTPQSVSKGTRATRRGTTYLRVLTLYVFPTNAFLAGLVDTYIGPRVCRLTRSVAPPRKPDDTPVTISIHVPPLPHLLLPLPIFATPVRPARQRQATAP